MPSRKRADHAAIAAVYLETGSGRETARRLGLHPNTVYQVLRLQRGKCRACANDVAFGRSYCPACLERERGRVTAERRRRMHEGICVQCNEPRHPASRMHCPKHRLAHLASSAQYDRREASRHVHGGIPNEAERDRRLRNRYGQTAVDVWHDLGGLCAMCGVDNRDRAVHVHHMNEDGTDGRRENLTLLCQRCHAMLHRLLKIDDLPRALAWIREHYPQLAV